jgi:hypothetical protein
VLERHRRRVPRHPRRLRPGGTIAVVSQPRGTAYDDADVVPRQLAEAGFTLTRTETLAIEPPAVCVLATRS